MADVVNLRMARKAKARSEATRQADANRAAHGQTKAVRRAAAENRDRAERILDGAKRSPS